MNCDTKYTITSLSALALAASLGVATAFAASALSTYDSPSRTWATDGFVPDPHRLIGLGCGPDRLTYTAKEEDHFPAPCYLVGTMDEVCPVPDGEYPPDMIDCVLFLGVGW